MALLPDDLSRRAEQPQTRTVGNDCVQESESPPRRLRYVGPPDIAEAARRGAGGRVIRTPEDLAGFVTDAGSEAAEPFTYIVDLDGWLRLAPRRSEHVACAEGQDVLAAGEIGFSFSRTWQVEQISNLSTGYCPDLDSWTAVESALDRVGLVHPDRFTDEIVFRHCAGCHQRNLVKDEVYVCQVCDCELPREWNFPANAADRDRIKDVQLAAEPETCQPA